MPRRTLSTTGTELALGDVCLFEFPFTSGVASKRRPALVLFDLGEDALICRVTSVIKAGHMNVPVKDWQAAGLAKTPGGRPDRLGKGEKTPLWGR